VRKVKVDMRVTGAGSSRWLNVRRMTSLACGVIAAGVVAGVAAAAMAGYGSRSHPYPIHSFAAIPDSHGWKVRLNGSVPNATAAVLEENQFNDRPAAGRQFFMINVTVAYTGKGSSTALGDLTFSALGRSNVAYDTSDDCGVVPKELDEFKKVFSGGSLTGNLCFSVKRSDVSSLLLLVDPGFSFSDAQYFFRVR
jgi:hypothetical protein